CIDVGANHGKNARCSISVGRGGQISKTDVLPVKAWVAPVASRWPGLHMMPFAPALPSSAGQSHLRCCLESERAPSPGNRGDSPSSSARHARPVLARVL